MHIYTYINLYANIFPSLIVLPRYIYVYIYRFHKLLVNLLVENFQTFKMFEYFRLTLLLYTQTKRIFLVGDNGGIYYVYLYINIIYIRRAPHV